MKPSEIRDELLSQHRGLRAHLDSAREVAERWARGEATRSDVRDELAGLADALRRHNLREERALGDLIRTMDPAGPARAAIMDDEHVGEHREMSDTLVRLTRAADPGEGGRELQNFCTRLLDHMTWEEKAFLNAMVLQDDDA
jgi:hypothetical protein